MSECRPESWRILVLHGAGSTARTARALLDPLWEASLPGAVEVTAPEDRTGDVETIAEEAGRWLIDSARTPGPRLIAGISLGAHAAMLSLARTPADVHPTVAVAALPAWSGDPDDTAALTALAGREVASHGITATLRRIRSQAQPHQEWIVEALDRDWPAYTEQSLPAVLSQAARSRAPDDRDLAIIAIPVLLLGMADDRLHPDTVVREWAGALPQARALVIEPGQGAGFADPEAVTALRALIA